MILLEGVKLRDFEEFYAKRASELVMDITSIPDKIISPIPHFFENKESWPRASNAVCCAWCNRTISEKPLFIPVNIETNLIYARGSFCDFPCLVAYVINTKEFGENYIPNVYYLYQKWNGFWPTYIPPAPNRLLLTTFGGNISPGEFLNEVARLNSFITRGEAPRNLINILAY